MREIVHIQAGQCGNQIGAKVCLFVVEFNLGLNADCILAKPSAIPLGIACELVKARSGFCNSKYLLSST